MKRAQSIRLVQVIEEADFRVVSVLELLDLREAFEALVILKNSVFRGAADNVKRGIIISSIIRCSYGNGRHLNNLESSHSMYRLDIFHGCIM